MPTNTAAARKAGADVRTVSTYCYNCVAGPDPLCVTVVDGVATEVTPNFQMSALHPAGGKPCVKAYGLVQKTYSPHRIKQPMKRTNPKKGMGEEPGFVPISWDEALDTVAAKLIEMKAKGKLDAQGIPRLAASFGHGGTPGFYMGSFNAFLSAWGAVDFSFGSGQGVKCVHSEHLYGELWHRAFTVAADTPRARYIISLGTNVEVSGGSCAVTRHADARVRGIKKVQVEPHLSVTGACAAEWVPIRPKTDPAFMFALIHAMLHEAPRERLDLAFLKNRTSSPYLIGPNGWYLRDPDSTKPLIWDVTSNSAKPFDTPGLTPALEGRFSIAKALEIGPDDERKSLENVEGITAFTKLADHMKSFTPDWAEKICDVPAATMRRIATEYLDNACIGQTIEIDGVTLPYRPVAVTLGKTVNNGWGAYECCWARTMLAVLVGALEVPGGTLGTSVRLHRNHDDRLKSVKPGPDGFMDYAFNTTSKEDWKPQPTGRNAHKPLVPLVGDFPWSQALGPTHFSWMFEEEAPENWPRTDLPDLWFVYRCNAAISFWDTRHLSQTMAKMPYVVAFAYTIDETNWMADILLPEATDLEGLQLIRFGGSKFVEQYWRHQGYILRQPVVAPQNEARDFTWISTELAKRTGLMAEYNTSINRGLLGAPLKGEGFDYTISGQEEHSVEDIWDRVCKAASAGLTGEAQGLDWFKQNGFLAAPFHEVDWYLFPTIEKLGLRFELPYQERLMRIGKQLERRLHENNIHWWEEQLEEYQALPIWHDHPARWEKELIRRGAKPQDYPFWLLTTKSMQYHTGANVSIQLMHEAAKNLRGFGGVIMNARTAKELGISEGDLVELSTIDGVTKGAAVPVQGIRPDVMVTVGQFDHWATPYAKEMGAPSINTIAPMSMALTDATGSGSDVARVAIRKV
ncbi:MAG: molybdopterin-dependent oxidoreductase [Alphaproteobacteria bacterium]|nr:molybdopterin-dependent oxidoreductase [Alphaproteobacteria bacterium]